MRVTGVVLVEVELINGIHFDDPFVGVLTWVSKVILLKEVGSFFVGRNIGIVEELAELILG